MSIESVQTLHDARLTVLALPGISHYVRDPLTPDSETDNQLGTMVRELVRQLRAKNEITYIIHNMGWGDEDTQAFFAHPARQPYRSQIGLPTGLQERADYFISIGRFLRLRYMDAQGEERTANAATLRTFFDTSLKNLFNPLVFQHTDRLNGIDPQDRRRGNIHPTEEMSQLMVNESFLVAEEEGKNGWRLHQDVLNATEGGNFTMIRPFLENNRGDRTLRKALERIFVRRWIDPALQREKLKILWAAETFRYQMGIDLQTFLDISGQPSRKVIETRIHKYLTNPDYVLQMGDHLGRETAPAIASFVPDFQPLDYFAVLAARAAYHRFPDSARTIPQLEEVKQNVLAQLRTVLPLAFQESPLNYVDAPTNPGAELRAFSFDYPNTEGETVSVAQVYPRVAEDRLRESFAHEEGHVLHKKMVRVREKAGLIPSGSVDRLPNQLKEAFAFLVQNQAARIWQSRRDDLQPAPGGEWANLYSALIMRRQGPFALAQLHIRGLMEQMWQRGKRSPLTDREADRILNRMQPLISKWYGEGLHIIFPHQSVGANIEPTRIDDGLIYLGKYVSGGRPSAGRPDFNLIFEEKFGAEWLLEKEARVVMLGLMAESGDNHDTSTYGPWVQIADVNKIRDRLHSWGISEKLI